MQTASQAFDEAVKSRYWQEEDAAVVLEAWRQSGLPRAAFARHWGLSDSRLGRWSQRLAAKQTPAFHPVRIVQATDVVQQAEWAGDVRCGSLVVRVPLGFVGDEVARLLRVVASC